MYFSKSFKKMHEKPESSCKNKQKRMGKKKKKEAWIKNVFSSLNLSHNLQVAEIFLFCSLISWSFSPTKDASHQKWLHLFLCCITWNSRKDLNLYFALKKFTSMAFWKLKDFCIWFCGGISAVFFVILLIQLLN